MRTAQDAIAAFAGWDGVAEYPPGSNANWLTEWYGMGPVPWCAITVSRALIEGGFGTAERIDIPGVSTTTAKGWAYCPYVEGDFRNAGRWYQDPQPADLVLYDWDGDGWSDHVGMVASVEADGSLYVWEGNTDEGVVRLKHRSMTYVRGFARPPYASPTPPQPPTPPEVPDVSKVAYPLTVQSGESRRLPILAIGGGFGWTKASVTFAAEGVDVRRAIVGPNQRDIPGLAPSGVATSQFFTGRGYVDLRPGDEWLAIELGDAVAGTLDLFVEAADG